MLGKNQEERCISEHLKARWISKITCLVDLLSSFSGRIRQNCHNILTVFRAANQPDPRGKGYIYGDGIIYLNLFLRKVKDLISLEKRKILPRFDLACTSLTVNRGPARTHTSERGRNKIPVIRLNADLIKWLNKTKSVGLWLNIRVSANVTQWVMVRVKCFCLSTANRYRKNKHKTKIIKLCLRMLVPTVRAIFMPIQCVFGEWWSDFFFFVSGYWFDCNVWYLEDFCWINKLNLNLFCPIIKNSPKKTKAIFPLIFYMFL